MSKKAKRDFYYEYYLHCPNCEMTYGLKQRNVWSTSRRRCFEAVLNLKRCRRFALPSQSISAEVNSERVMDWLRGRRGGVWRASC